MARAYDVRIRVKLLDAQGVLLAVPMAELWSESGDDGNWLDMEGVSFTAKVARGQLMMLPVAGGSLRFGKLMADVESVTVTEDGKALTLACRRRA